MYEFTCYYDNGSGDHYSGYFYGSPGSYTVGQHLFPFTDENGQPGYYTIDAVHAGVPGENGQVFVDSYYDAESLAYQTVATGNPVGTAGLGSEDAYIRLSGVPEYRFGGGYYEADLVAYGYVFTFTYSGGDGYMGRVYAVPEDEVYRPSHTFQTTAEGGQTGEYGILQWKLQEYAGLSKGDVGMAGQVLVETYYDSESDNIYTPVSNGTAIGTAYLESEHDYIIMTGVPEYYFGGGYYEADLVTYAYDFTLTYSGGDFYNGVVYATPEKGYDANYTLTTAAEGGQTGTYAITNITPGFEVALAGKVYVNTYRDSESGNTYTPVSNGTAVGTAYLTSESDHIINASVPDFYFGGGYWEADLGAVFTYTFTYGCGDYYTGTVYASQDRYFVGYTKGGLDENGQWSSYTITGVASYLEDTTGYGQVTIAAYYDMEMKRVYIPTFSWGSSYLGSESGFINISSYPEIFDPALGFPYGIMKFYFGGGYYEADVKGSAK